MNSMELSNYLEKVRLGRKVTQEEFVFGIVSLRQYQRYRSGESEIPYEKLEKFAEKLGIPSRKLLNEFEKEKNEQASRLNRFYSAVVTRDRPTVERMIKEFRHDFIIDEEKKVFYKHSIILNNFFEGRLSRESTARQTADLINYPAILKQQYFTDVEVLVMSSLLEFEQTPKRQTLLNRLSDLFEAGEGIMSGGTDLIYYLILMRLSKSHGKQRNYDKVISFCDMGINRGMKTKNYYLWDYFFYYKALAYHALEDYEQFEHNLFRCFSVLRMEANQHKLDMFTAWIEKDFGVSLSNFAIQYLKKEIS